MKPSWRLAALLTTLAWACSCSSDGSSSDDETIGGTSSGGGQNETDSDLQDTDSESESESESATQTPNDTRTGDDSGSETAETDATDEDTGSTAGACVFRVSTGGSPEGDGLSWSSTFSRVNSALKAAAAEAAKRPKEERCQVWVAKGVYYIFESNRKDTVRLRPRVDLLGGFGGDESRADERDADAHITVLDGHRSADDWTNQVLHVVTGADNSLIEGFSISGGDAAVSFDTEDPDNYGGGMVNDGVSPTVRGCVFTENSAAWDGALANLKGSEALIEGCTFANNIAQAIFNNQSSVTITDTIVVGNHGGGISTNGEKSNTTVQNAVISGNRNYGIESWFGAVTTVVSATVVGNYPGYEPDAPAGATAYQGSNAFFSSILWSNGPGSVREEEGGRTTLEYSNIDDDSTDGEGNIFSAPELEGFEPPLHEGSWTAIAYDPGTGTTRLVDGAAAWNPGALTGLFLRLETNQESGGAPMSPIIDNDAASIRVRGDISWLVDESAGYALLDLRLGAESPCIDAGDGDKALPHDITGRSRHDDPSVSDTGRGSPSYVDIGAYERAN